MPVQLMQYTDPVWYGFFHAMDHRSWIAVWGNTRSSYTAIPYFINEPDTPEWRLNHAQAHHDALDAPPNPIGPFSEPVGKVMGLSGPTDYKNASEWWTFQNHMEHYLAAQNISENNYQTYYPYW